MRILGVTGGCGTGKSTVCRILEEHGGIVLDADQIARELQSVGGPAYRDIVEAFGSGILQKDRRLDRKKLAEMVFRNPALRRQLNQAVHRHVSSEIKRRIREIEAQNQSKEAFLVLDVPLPIEDGFFDVVDRIWTVTANCDLRADRLIARMGISRAEADARIRSQMSSREYEAIADTVIENEKGEAELRAAVEKALADFLATRQVKFD